MTSIPSSMTFEMLSKLPANSFSFKWVAVQPDQAPANDIYDLNIRNNPKILLRGATNEYLLNTNIYLCGTRRINTCVTDNVGNITPAVGLVDADIAEFIAEPPQGFQAPIHNIAGSRETFNSGSLVGYDNQDRQRSHIINELRYRLAKRNNNSYTGAEDLVGALGNTVGRSLELARNDLRLYNRMSDGIRLQYYNTTNTNIETRQLGGDQNFQIPLGTYSSLINTHSVIPLGLFSSYSVNGWSIAIDLANSFGQIGLPVYGTAPTFTTTGGVIADLRSRAYMNDLKVFMPIVTIYDPAVNEAILSLYEKRQMVKVNNFEFPLSLRLNSINYRTFDFPLRVDQKDYFFRLAGTDRSVRAIAWWIYDKDRQNIGEYTLSDGVKVTRIETKIGSEEIHPVIEDRNDNTNNVGNFVSMNAKRSGGLFSPLPYYQETRKFDGMQDDYLAQFNNRGGAFNFGFNEPVKKSLAYGVISLENLDRREADYSGSFQASGKDLTNVGGIEMRMRIEESASINVEAYNAGFQYTPELLNSTNFRQNLLSSPNLEIVFMYAYDHVIEISPQGVFDVTNAVM